MVQDDRNVIPVSMAVLLHVLVFGSLLVAFDFGERVTPAMPLAIKGTLVTDNAVVIPPKEEAPPPEPVITEEERIRAEEQKRLEDQRIEQERLNRLAQEEAERKRKAEEEAERRRQAELEAERRRKADEEAEKERRRIEAERQRQLEIERQRLENERRRAEAEAESNRLQAMQANAKAAYMFAIQQRISRNWVKPPTATAGIECVVNIKQLPGGDVVSVNIGSCNADSAVRQSIVAAVHRASPLPQPADPSVFDRDIRLIFRPDE
ncbi:MAG TPA: cell envelope integrity protein TolA [Woeseiaceae bacterium]|nr:cell envelope integrity protein TolA [Woeseiaceae bacterium]